MFLLLAGLCGIGLLGLTGKALPLPASVVGSAEARVNQMLATGGAPGAQLAIGSAEVVIGRDFVPRLQVEGLRLLGAEGRSLATLPQVQLTLQKGALLRGTFRLTSLRIIGAQITLHRAADGRLDLAYGGEIDETGPGNLGELLDRIEAAFTKPALSALVRVDAEALTLTLDDRRANRVWQVGDGHLTLDNRPGEVALQLGFGLVGGGTAPARASVIFVSDKKSSAARISATVDQVAAVDLAAQTPALAWLSVLDAPISGRLAVALDGAGAVTSGDGALDIGRGTLHPAEGARPVAFDKAGLTFAVDPVAETIRFSNLSVESPSLRITSSGLMRVPGLAAGVPQTFIGQVRVAGVSVDPEGLFAAPVRFSDGAIDFRLRLNPFRLEIGQVSLTEGRQRVVAKGALSADARGWTVALDFAVNESSHERLLALWPPALAPKTRIWLADNVQQGLLTDVKGGLRLEPGADPVLSLGFAFSAADVRFLHTLPLIRDGYGYATLIGKTYTVMLERGGVTPPKGGRIDAAGSVFQVPDVTIYPADAEITLKTDSTVTAVLSLLDQPPFGFLTNAGYPVDLAEGRAVTTASLRMPLRPKVGLNDVTWQVEGALSDVISDKLVKGRRLRAAALRLQADNKGMRISGPGQLGKADFDAAWSRDFGPGKQGKSRVGGSIALSQPTLDEFAVRLPEGAVTGAGTGKLAMDLVPGGGSFTITSDLRGVALAFSPIALTKKPEAAADLRIEGRLGQPNSIDLIRLDSGKVSVEGSVTLRSDGTLDIARFPKVVSGDWLDALVDLTGQGAGKDVGIAITGGTLDLRRMPDLGAAAGEGPPMQVALDTLRVTKGIALTNLQGSFATKGGLSGDFTALVNNAAPVRGTVSPAANGTAARILSDDAGAVIAAAGIFKSAQGGSLDLALQPRGGSGEYDGQAKIGTIQVRDAPILADLLGAISVIGLLEQLNNSGLVFSSAEAAFRTSPEGITISRGSAVGASLGVSLSGAYRNATDTLAMQGVISPIYLLNGIGSILTRPGEGLFGFNFDLSGPVSNPAISVNPLSILTPGMFREMFRTAPPSGNRPPQRLNSDR